MTIVGGVCQQVSEEVQKRVSIFVLLAFSVARGNWWRSIPHFLQLIISASNPLALACCFCQLAVVRNHNWRDAQAAGVQFAGDHVHLFSEWTTSSNEGPILGLQRLSHRLASQRPTMRAASGMQVACVAREAENQGRQAEFRLFRQSCALPTIPGIFSGGELGFKKTIEARESERERQDEEDRRRGPSTFEVKRCLRS